MSDITRRVDHIEWRLDSHNERLEDMRTATEKLEHSLNGIEQNVQQIKWIFVGICLAYVVGELGLPDALAAVL